MAKRKGKCVGSIFGLRELRQSEQYLNHFLYLEFAGASIADGGFFGFFWLVFKNGNFFLGCGKDRDAARHPELHGALKILMKKLRLNRYSMRLMLI